MMRIDFAIKCPQIDAEPALIGSIIRRCSKFSIAEIAHEPRIARYRRYVSFFFLLFFFIEHFFDLISDLREPW